MLKSALLAGALGVVLAACASAPPPETMEEIRLRAVNACPGLMDRAEQAGQYDYLDDDDCTCVANQINQASWNPETSTYDGPPAVTREDALAIANTIETATSLNEALKALEGKVSPETQTEISGCFISAGK